ncbi:Transducin beta-like protein 2 [Frankliniella fusca]|uniref:Transducin beta-like protein 2 n=1 Tax=Frankliniella fusca TaxID=407009 RepID=A0AAE1LFH9_9NEOP|nr:Transducin beta-like protein 2 [Frankliniella fusca]
MAYYRAVVLWNAKHLDQKEHKNLRVNVEFDHAVMVRWSPDSKAFIIHKGVENVVEVHKVSKKPDGWIGPVTKAITFPKAHVEDVVGMDIAVNGRFIMTCSEKTDLVLWDLKGERLASLDTLTVQTHRARISPCGHFVAASGFTPDVKVWEVLLSKSGEFDRVARAFELKGHSSGVYDFAFSADSSRVATISKDGNWRVFDTKVEYQKGEEPRLLRTGKHDGSAAVKSRLAIAPDGESFAVATGSDLWLYVVNSGRLLATIHDVYSGPINCVRFDSTGKFVLTAGDRHVRVFHNMAHHAAAAEVSAARLKQSGLSAATKDRLAGLVASSEDFLDSFGVGH